MLAMSTKAILSLDQFEKLPDDGMFHELDEGELISMAPTSEGHGDIEAEIVTQLRLHVKQQSLGKVYCGDMGFRLDEDTVRAPDVAFVRKERLGARDRTRYFDGAPDLAVEIFSPSDSVPQLMRKVRQYLRAGSHTVWVVYPETKEMQVFEAAGADRILRAGDLLDAPELLPGFSIPVSALFE